MDGTANTFLVIQVFNGSWPTWAIWLSWIDWGVWLWGWVIWVNRFDTFWKGYSVDLVTCCIVVINLRTTCCEFIADKVIALFLEFCDLTCCAVGNGFTWLTCHFICCENTVTVSAYVTDNSFLGILTVSNCFNAVLVFSLNSTYSWDFWFIRCVTCDGWRYHFIKRIIIGCPVLEVDMTCY